MGSFETSCIVNNVNFFLTSVTTTDDILIYDWSLLYGQNEFVYVIYWIVIKQL